VSSLPPARSEIRPPSESVAQRMRIALKQLSEMMENPEIATRDPSSSLSFSCLTPDVIKSQNEGLKFYGNDHWKAYCPLGPNGRPLRRSSLLLFFSRQTPCSILLHFASFSDRKSAHWFQSDRYGLSYAGSFSFHLYFFPHFPSIYDAQNRSWSHQR
jgi:hypothetical protein